MAMGAAIFSGVMSVAGARKQRRAGQLAQSAAEEGARGIEAETEMNIGQTRRRQAQTMGLAKANIAASGVRFDASKIAAVKFTEGGTRTTTLAEQKGALAEREKGLLRERGILGGVLGGGALSSGLFGKLFNRPFQVEVEGGEQIAGETEGDSIFTYLKEMKSTFSKDIAWQGKEGRSRAKVARMGGQIAKAQAYAGAMASIGSAVGSFASAAK